MLREVYNHRVDMIDGCLKLFIALFTFSQTEWAALIRTCWATSVAHRSMAFLTILAGWVAKIPTLYLTCWTFPFCSVTHV